MSKKIMPSELAEIVAGLLIKPELFGELDCPERHSDFIRRIGDVVADFCGGEITGTDTKRDPATGAPLVMLRVLPDECLPSPGINVWSAYDLPGWEGLYEYDTSEKMTDAQVLDLRTALKGLLQAA